MELLTVQVTLLETQKAWLACALDTEGTLSIYECQRRSRHTSQFKSRITICNTNDLFIYEIKKLCPDSFINPKRGNAIQRHENRWKSLFEIELNVDEARRILVLIMPYLIVKRRQAELMLEFLNLRHINNHLPNRLRGQNSVQYRRIVEEMKKLNKRGK